MSRRVDLELKIQGYICVFFSNKDCRTPYYLYTPIQNALEKRKKRIHRIHVYSSTCARPHTRLAGLTTPRLACGTNRT
jgi:hypothetical protein